MKKRIFLVMLNLFAKGQQSHSIFLILILCSVEFASNAIYYNHVNHYLNLQVAYSIQLYYYQFLFTLLFCKEMVKYLPVETRIYCYAIHVSVHFFQETMCMKAYTP